MPQLTKHFFRDNRRAYGLTESQMRGPYGDEHDSQWCHNAGWYNRAGEKLGWGDLSPGDFKRLRDELDEGEFFVAIPETASYWDLAEALPGLEDLYAPGTEYVVEHASYVITRGRVYMVAADYAGSQRLHGTKKEQAGIVLEFKTKAELLALLKG